MVDEKPAYVQINRKIWNTSQFRELSREARELFWYLTTCPHGNMIGLFVMRPGYAVDDLQWESKERFREPFKELLDKGLFKYDPKTEIILDVEQLEKHPPANPNQVTACIKIINSLPKTFLFQELKQIAERFNKPLMEPLIKRLGERYAYTVTVTVTETVTETALNSVKRRPENPEDNSTQDAFLKNQIEEEKAEKEKIKTEFMDELKDLMDNVAQRYHSQRDQQAVLIFVQANINNKHPKAILHCIRSLVKVKEQIRSPNIAAWLNSALRVENGNYNAADEEKKCNELKNADLSTFYNAIGGS